MRISYSKLWKMLSDKNMNKHDLKESGGGGRNTQKAGGYWI